MAEIRVLDKHTAELIAAGEVVERPASVAKELLENAIDAGATQITLSAVRGGIQQLQIVDNGSGIEAEYIDKAFIRHATSKIATAEDLGHIHTLGFRGEALASIASVARVEVLTRTEADEYACCYRIEGGEERGMEPGARPVGTTITVSDLFYNTPARMKFLKKDASEGTFVAETVLHAALSHPEISFRYLRDGKQQYVTPGDGDLRSAVYAVLGREFARDLLPVDGGSELYHVTGLVTPPRACRASRGAQHFFVNGRYVKNRTMMAALENAYKGTMMQGKFPGGILLLEMPADLVDVNVHPAKIEARFARENDVFDVVYHAVKLALAQPGTGERLFTFEADKEEKAENSKKDTDIIKNDVKNNSFTGLSAIIRGQADPGVLPQQHWEPAKPAAAPQQPAPAAAMQIPTVPSVPRWKGSAQNEDMLDPFVTLHSPKLKTTKAPEPFRAAASETQLDVEPEFGETKLHSPQDHMAAWNPAQEAPKEEPESAPCAETEPDAPEAAEQETVLAEPEQMNFDPTADQPEPLRYVGEVFRTYILAERGDELCLIDKHAAHERQLYEKLAANYGNVPSQMLLEPAAIDLAAEEKQALLDNIPLLENAGLEIADFGGNTVVLRAVPADVEPQNAESLLVEIANKLLRGGHDALNEHTEWVLHSISCRAAIKAGDKSSPQELLALAEKILSGEVPPFCPHGRPCVLKLTRKELEKQFGRIV